MKLTYVTDTNILDPDDGSGTGFWISKSLQETGIALEHAIIMETNKFSSPLQRFIFLGKQLWTQYYKRAVLEKDLCLPHAKHIAKILNTSLMSSKTNAILTTLSPIAGAYLETNKPIIYWTDMVYAGMVGFYPRCRFHHPDTMWDAYHVTDACLKNAALLIFSSEWAARSAIELHGISKNKIHVVPFGANLAVTHTFNDVKAMIKARSTACIKFLFVGKYWHRKGGDMVLNVLNALHASGQKIELTIAGCSENDLPYLPFYAKCLGMLYKKNAADVEKLNNLYKESHFLFMPSRAEAFGIVFCEANAFGVPCIASQVGGIADVVQDRVNGMTFSLEATIKDHCDRIMNLMSHRNHYEELALSSFNEYQNRLNWKTSANKVKNLIEQVI
jgi:glycosyltransferase involved in cell wall biosynthesis